MSLQVQITKQKSLEIESALVQSPCQIFRIESESAKPLAHQLSAHNELAQIDQAILRQNSSSSMNSGSQSNKITAGERDKEPKGLNVEITK